jgi:uncharacterized integral membrane protein
MSDTSSGPPPEQPGSPPAGGTVEPHATRAVTPAGSEPTPADPQPSGTDRSRDKDPLRGSRTSGVWIALAVVGILIVLLVVFTLQNTQEVGVAFLGWEGQLPLSAAILIAAAAGILITALAGSLRILQLRRRVKHQR